MKLGPLKHKCNGASIKTAGTGKIGASCCVNFYTPYCQMVMQLLSCGKCALSAKNDIDTLHPVVHLFNKITSETFLGWGHRPIKF